MSFQTPFTCELEYQKHVFLGGRWHFSYANQSQKEKQSGNNADAVLNNSTDLESENWCLTQYFSGKFRCNGFNHTENKDNDMRRLGCLAGAKKIQTSSENISFKLIRWCEFIWCFVSWNTCIHILFFLGNYYLNKTKLYF